jgi:uncharacterized membrane protein
VSARPVVALRFTLLLWLGSLFALLGVQRLFGDMPMTPLARFTVFVVQAAPLLVVAPLLVRPGPRGALWLCLLTPFYFVHGVWQYGAPDTRVFGVLEVVFALGAFVSSCFLLKLLPRGADVKVP